MQSYVHAIMGNAGFQNVRLILHTTGVSTRSLCNVYVTKTCLAHDHQACARGAGRQASDEIPFFTAGPDPVPGKQLLAQTVHLNQTTHWKVI